MITKEDLLERIDEALRTEEAAVPLYLQNYTAALNWLGLSDANRELVRDTLQRLARESEGHKATLERIKQKVIEEGRDAF